MPLTRAEKIGIFGAAAGLGVGFMYFLHQRSALKTCGCEGDYSTWKNIMETPLQETPTSVVVDDNGNVYIFTQTSTSVVRPDGRIEKLEGIALNEGNSFLSLSVWSAYQQYMALPSADHPGEIDVFRNGTYLLSMSTGHGQPSTIASISQSGEYIALAGANVIQLWKGSKR